MANVDSPYGFRLHNSGGKCSYLGEYTIASAYNTALFEGDVVKLTGTSTNIEQASVADENPIGILKGVRYVDSGGNQVFTNKWVANTVATDIKALVYDDPGYEFIAQADTFVADDAGLTADWTATAGSASTGVSGEEVTSSAAHATTGSLHIIGLAPLPKNAVGANAKILVRFKKHDRAVDA